MPIATGTSKPPTASFRSGQSNRNLCFVLDERIIWSAGTSGRSSLRSSKPSKTAHPSRPSRPRSNGSGYPWSSTAWARISTLGPLQLFLCQQTVMRRLLCAASVHAADWSCCATCEHQLPSHPSRHPSTRAIAHARVWRHTHDHGTCSNCSSLQHVDMAEGRYHGENPFWTDAHADPVCTRSTWPRAGCASSLRKT